MEKRRRMEYEDVELEISRSESGSNYIVQIHSRPGGEGEKEMPFLDERRWEENHKNLQVAIARSGNNIRSSSSDEQIVKKFGQDLFMMLPEGIRGKYHAAIDNRGSKGLRLKLRLPPELATLPWEFMYDTRQADFISISTKTPMIRHIEQPMPVKSLTVNPPLRILGMVANTNDQKPLDVAFEKKQVEDAIREMSDQKLVELKWIEGQTSDDLRNYVRNEIWHVFHFIGHGGFEREAKEGYIYLAKDGKQERFYGSKLVSLLGENDSLRLVFLNSCEGAHGKEDDICSSTAAKLHRRGIPAVVAMQYAITDKAAIKFVSTFYKALIKEQRPVEECVSDARQAVYLDTVEWGTPVLYMQDIDGKLFNINKPPKPEINIPGGSPKKREIEELEPNFNEVKSTTNWITIIEIGEKILNLEQGYEPVCSETAKAYVSWSESLSERKDYPNATFKLNRAIALESKNASYYYKRGILFSKQGLYERAIKDFDNAIDIEGNAARASYYFERGFSYFEINRFDDALKDLNEAIKKDPNNAQYLYSRSRIHTSKRDDNAANADIEKAIQIDPNNSEYYYKQGMNCINRGQNEEAIPYLDKAIQRDPNNASYYLSRSLCFTCLGKNEKAKSDYDKAIQIDPGKFLEILRMISKKG
jgi:tetratricopeptide (TPR) repeat protein